MEKLLEVKDLNVSFNTDDGSISVVNGIDLSIYKGETVGLVGESGCGKSVTSLSLMGLVPSQGKVTGNIFYKDADLLSLKEEEMRKKRGKELSMIFQEPMTALDPVFTIGNQLIEAIRLHSDRTKKQVADHAKKMLEQVGIPGADSIMKGYPHQLSGGMRQRVMIAMAMSLNPSLLIADEPTTALDVTIQAQIMDLMKDLKQSYETSILLITHDLGVVAEICDRVIVMYAGKVVEETDVETLFENPQHPYTKGLLESIPKIDGKKGALYSIPGSVPSPKDMTKGCRFEPRCEHAMPICRIRDSELMTTENNHSCRCWLYSGEGETQYGGTDIGSQ